MDMMTSRSLAFDRKKLAANAMKAAIQARNVAGVDFVSPVNAYDACEKHGVIVRFNDISMEGMYDREPKPRIHISSLRPLARRNLTCAHELGHHVFGHGSTIDELNNRVHIADHNDPIEFIANQFAYFLMMPTLGVRNALASRKIDLGTVSAKELFAISSNFGVGYTTLLNHLRYSLNLLPDPQFQTLRRVTPKVLRSELLQTDTETPVVLVDECWSSPTIDLETDDFLVLPSRLSTAPKQLCFIGRVPNGFAYQACHSGIGRAEIAALGSAYFVRVAKRSTVDGRSVGYIGLAKYRHLEDEDE
tara:strand:+ start:825 stop:1736 length:912 start_codon:yes stop_codon:yes gene_type:complete